MEQHRSAFDSELLDEVYLEGPLSFDISPDGTTIAIANKDMVGIFAITRKGGKSELVVGSFFYPEAMNIRMLTFKSAQHLMVLGEDDSTMLELRLTARGLVADVAQAG